MGRHDLKLLVFFPPGPEAVVQVSVFLQCEVVHGEAKVRFDTFWEGVDNIPRPLATPLKRGGDTQSPLLLFAGLHTVAEGLNAYV